MEKRVATATPALSLLQRRQLLRLAEQTAGAALLGAPSLVVGHDLKLSADAAAKVRPRVVRIATFNPAEMHLVGQLVNLSAPLMAVFETMPAGLLPPAEHIQRQPEAGRLGNGVVQRAVVKVLAVAQRPMRVLEVHGAVEGLLGHPVSKDSVSWCLASGVRAREPRFERVAYGCYRLAQQT